MQEAVLYEKTGNGMVKCKACSWYCAIPKGSTGVCAVRQNINGKLYLLVYGQAYGLQVDPVEKKPLFHFYPGSSILSLGTVGCNFGCLFCQNFDESQVSKELKYKLAKTDNLPDLKTQIENISRRISPGDLIGFALENKIAAIAYTYNEPAIFIEYAFDAAKLAHKHNILNVFVSNGFESKETLEYIGPYLDAINIDLKSFSSKFYREVCRGQLEPVLECINRVYRMNIWEEITTLIIPGKNDGDAELGNIAKFIVSVSKDIPWHVTAFHPDYKFNNYPKTPERTLIKAYNIGREAGLKYVYAGNILNNKYESTYCPKCGVKLISRSWYDIEIVSLKDGHCGKCNEKIAGRWN